MDPFEILDKYRRIAVVGLDSDPNRFSNSVSAYMLAAGYDITPVNPNETEVFGLTAYNRVEEAPGPVEIVNVFRRPQFIPDIVEDAIAAGAKVVWLQSGIRNDEAAKRAQGAGLEVIQDTCIRTVHQVGLRRGLITALDREQQA
jgi:predicted CoA-binding protein